MAPKSWNRTQGQVATPSLGTASVPTPSPAASIDTSKAKKALENYVLGELHQNNILGMSDDELKGGAAQLVSCASRAEVFSWCETFGLGTVVAAEVVKRREDSGPFFEGEGPRVHAGSRTLSLASKKAGNKSRGVKKAVTELSSAATLVEGQFFECGCFALTHAFRGNCANCGRIFCMQESMDSCYHCCLDPTRCLAYEIKVQTGIMDEAAQQRNAQALQQARDKRDQLLQYAKEKAKRTTVIDDQSGVFLESKNAWNSAEERSAAETAEAAERRKQISNLHKKTGAYTVHLDIVNQNVALGARVEDFVGASSDVAAPQDVESAASADVSDEDDSDGGYDAAHFAGNSRVVPNPHVKMDGLDPVRYGRGGGKEAVSRLVHESLRLQNDYFEDDALLWAERAAEVLHSTACSSSAAASSNAGDVEGFGIFTFNVPKAPELLPPDDTQQAPAAVAADDLRSHFAEQAELERSHGVTKAMRAKDEAMCLSMHQPWASLLVAGIKTHEGRTWSSDYRGKLWIHAASAKPSDIAGIEEHYRKFCPKGTSFPAHYPTGCLLGYVYVTDCLDHDAYHATFAESERQEDSPFKFICAGATALPFPLAMDGKNKIYKMDRKIWLAAKKQLNERVQ